VDRRQALAYVGTVRWHPTKPDGQFADAPHEYTRRSEAPDVDTYYELVGLVRREGIDRPWRGHMFRYLALDDGYSYWVAEEQLSIVF